MSFVYTSDTAFDASVPKQELDWLIDENTLACFDFLNKYCFSGNALPVDQASIANNSLLNNLVVGGPQIKVIGTTAKYSTSGGIVLDGASYLRLSDTLGSGSVGNNYNFATNNDNFEIIVWIKQAAASSNYTQLLGRSTSGSAPNCQYRLDLGLGGLSPRVTIGGATSTKTVNTSGAASLNTFYQYAFSRVGLAVSFFRNGLFTQGDTLVDATLANPTVSEMQFGSGFQGSIARLLIKKVGAGQVPYDHVKEDYTTNIGRFS